MVHEAREHRQEDLPRLRLDQQGHEELAGLHGHGLVLAVHQHGQHVLHDARHVRLQQGDVQAGDDSERLADLLPDGRVLVLSQCRDAFDEALHVND
eukprot:scaffold725_cov162-Ochromonas_danica.AAC.25